MTIETFPTSPPNSPFRSAVNIVDATAGNEEPIIDRAADAAPGTEITFIKSDGSANTVTIKDTDANTLGVLEAQGDAMTFFRGDTALWNKKSNSSAVDVSTHAALTTAHGSAGEVQGADDVQDALTNPAVETILDPFGNVVAEFTPGGNDAVNKFRFTNAETGADVEVSADGDDADVGIVFNAKGAGEFDFIGPLKENDNLVALSTATEVDEPEDSVEVTSPTVAEFNALVAIVADLRAASIAARVAVAAP